MAAKCRIVWCSVTDRLRGGRGWRAPARNPGASFASAQSSPGHPIDQSKSDSAPGNFISLLHNSKGFAPPVLLHGVPSMNWSLPLNVGLCLLSCLQSLAVEDESAEKIAARPVLEVTSDITLECLPRQQWCGDRSYWRSRQQRSEMESVSLDYRTQYAGRKSLGVVRKTCRMILVADNQ